MVAFVWWRNPSTRRPPHPGLPSDESAPRAWLVPVALGVLGAALRLWQYATGASLWADEANMALNIVDRPLGRLLGPLDYRQMAPPGWLLLQKAAVTLLGDGEHALRLIPLLGSLADAAALPGTSRARSSRRASAGRSPSGSSRSAGRSSSSGPR